MRFLRDLSEMQILTLYQIKVQSKKYKIITMITTQLNKSQDVEKENKLLSQINE